MELSLNGVLVIQSPLPDNSLLQLAQGGPILQFQIQEVKTSENWFQLQEIQKKVENVAATVSSAKNFKFILHLHARG